ncbi:MAG: hypothetical protein EBY63_04430, partial [Flavobacteriia bacterium]|nr:hypothetical protein [Flavobacteriia bacterium]
MKRFLLILGLLPWAATAQVMDSTLLDEVEVQSERTAEKGTTVYGKDIRFTTGAEGGVEGVVKTFAGVSSRN